MPSLVLGTLFVLIGLAFKLAAVPFHFWCPDVFEGAAAEVGGVPVGGVEGRGARAARPASLLGARPTTPAAARPDLMVPLPGAGAGVLRGPDRDVRQPGRLSPDQPQAAAGLLDDRPRRLHDDGPGRADAEGAEAVLFYLVAYLFMNLGAFAVVAFLRNQTGSEDLADFRGLIHRSPVLVVTLGVFLLSLLGLPPLAGFAAKFQIFAAVYHAGRGSKHTVAGQRLLRRCW